MSWVPFVSSIFQMNCVPDLQTSCAIFDFLDLSVAPVSFQFFSKAGNEASCTIARCCLQHSCSRPSVDSDNASLNSCMLSYLDPTTFVTVHWYGYWYPLSHCVCTHTCQWLFHTEGHRGDGGNLWPATVLHCALQNISPVIRAER